MKSASTEMVLTPSEMAATGMTPTLMDAEIMIQPISLPLTNAVFAEVIYDVANQHRYFTC